MAIEPVATRWMGQGGSETRCPSWLKPPDIQAGAAAVLAAGVGYPAWMGWGGWLEGRAIQLG